MTIQGTRTDIAWVDEIQHWQEFDTQRSLKELAAKYLPKDPSEIDWTPAPEPKPLIEMSKADRALMKAIYWSYFHGAAQQWKERNGSQEH